MTVPAPLRGRRVVDLTQFLAGPVCGQLLADFGAEVVKVEPPDGDPSRAFRRTAHGSIYFRTYNTGRRSERLDLDERADLDRLESLLAESDALVTNLGPRTLRRLRLGWGELHRRHPHLTVGAVTGYGLDDERGCFDAVAQAESGYAELNAWVDGTPHVAAGYPVDVLAGLHAGIGVAMALCTGTDEGVLVDVAMVEVAASVLCGAHGLEAVEVGHVPAGQGNRDRAAAPAGVYPCTDGHVYVYAGVDHHWVRLRPLVGGPDWPLAERIANAGELDRLVSAWTRTQRVAEVCDALAELGIPGGPVRSLPEAVAALGARRPQAVATRLPDGQAVPTFPALFSGERLVRAAAPADPGGRA